MADKTSIESTALKRESIIATMLLATSLLEILAMAHHPHVQTTDLAQAAREIVAASPLAELIHGLVIVCTFLTTYCLGEILAPRIPPYLGRAAALVYAGGLAAILTAATVDGWVVERLTATLSSPSAVDLENYARLVHLCMAWVVSSTNIGIVMTSCGILIASAGLLQNQKIWQIGGTLGVVVGLALIVSILGGRLTLDGHGALVAILLQAAWFCVIAIVSLASSRAIGPQQSTVL